MHLNLKNTVLQKLINDTSYLHVKDSIIIVIIDLLVIFSLYM